jgi:ketosteroid isomerase-like protein
MRLTAVPRREDDAWKVVHLHVSVGAPDEDAPERP